MLDGDSSMRAPRQRHGLVEAVVARGEIAGDAIDLAERRIDGENALRFGLERRLVAAHVGDRAEQRPRVEVRGIGLENLVEALARGVVARVVEIELGEEQLRVGVLGVDLQRLFGSRGRGRRILGCERARHANVRRRPVRPIP